jgi:hypothetical protein
MSKENKKSTWVCPKCGQAVTAYITVIGVPTCTKHIKGGQAMVEVKEEGV